MEVEIGYRNKINIIPSLDFILTHRIKWEPVGGYFTHEISARPSHSPESEDKTILKEDGISRHSQKYLNDWRIREGTLKSKELILSNILEQTKRALSETSKEVKENDREGNKSKKQVKRNRFSLFI